MFEILYKKILGVNYKKREINNIEEKILRKDYVYELLVKKYFYDKNIYKKLLIIFEKLTLKTSTQLSFKAYLYALNDNWVKALETIEEVIHLEKGENIDSFIDYGHFLRKIPKYEKLSNKLLLNIYFYMDLYKRKNISERKIPLIKIFYE